MEMDREALGTISVKSIKHETPKAWLAILEDNKEIWFPKSKCKIENNVMYVPQWLLQEKGLVKE